MVGLPAAQAAYIELLDQDKAALSWAVGGPNRVPGGYADIYYVPASHSLDFVRLCRGFVKHRVWVEIAVPTVFAMLAGMDIASAASYKGSQFPGAKDDSDWKAAASATGRPTRDHMAGFHSLTQDLEGRRLWMTDRTTSNIWKEQYSVAIDYVSETSFL